MEIESMTIYVDDMRMKARVGRLNARWSHLMADTSEELLEFAKKLGLKESWIQNPGTWKEHFDVTDSMREKAIKMGAKDIKYGGKISRELTERKIKELGYRK